MNGLSVDLARKVLDELPNVEDVTEPSKNAIGCDTIGSRRSFFGSQRLPHCWSLNRLKDRKDE
ncbi:MAG: hypothetical protein HWD61_11845 [Parachlamydiaceae bacterium]|nr:MAG: hypothetical protein HWD61_11845 [Parachlamydiaceae bacterium]